MILEGSDKSIPIYGRCLFCNERVQVVSEWKKAKLTSKIFLGKYYNNRIHINILVIV